MKTFLKLAAALFFFFVLMRMCSDGEPASASYDTPSSESDKADRFKEKHDLSEDAMRKLLESDKVYLSQVIGNFDYQEDEFTGLGWYTHKQDGKNRQNQTGLIVKVNKEGDFILSSNYHGSDWLFHESVTVKIGERVITSSNVPFNDTNNVKNNKDGHVWETVTYTKENDRNMLFAVGSNPEKTIKIRFNGRDKSKDVTLSEKQKQIIADYSFLAQLLSSINAKETALQNK